MSSYLPHEETYAVCSFDVSGNKQNFYLGDDRQQTITAIHKSNYPLLTVNDKQLSADFNCKNNWSGPISWGSLFAGFAIGMALVFGGPLVWAIAVAAAVVSVAVSICYSNSKAKKCTPDLFIDWASPHETVYIERHKAITKMSFLTCSVGGVITPFLDEDAADAAAKANAFNNRVELGMIAGISFLGGMGLGYVAATGSGIINFAGLGLNKVVAGGLAAGTDFGVGYLAGKIVYEPFDEYVTKPLQERYLAPKDNPMLQEALKIENPSSATWKPSDLYEFPDLTKIDATQELLELGRETKQVQSTIAELETLNARAEAELIKEKLIASEAAEKYNQSVEAFERAKNQGSDNLKQVGELQNQQKAVQQAIETAKQTGTLDKDLNRDIGKIYERIRNGEFGKQAQETLFGKNNDGRGRNVRSNYEKINEAIKQDIAREQGAITESQRNKNEVESSKNKSQQQLNEAQAKEQNTKNTISDNKAKLEQNKLKAEAHSKKMLIARLQLGMSIATLLAPIVQSMWTRDTMYDLFDRAMEDPGSISVVASEH